MPDPVILIPGIEIDSPHLQRALQDSKLLVERIAQGHSIDDITKTLGDIIKHAIAAPRGVGETVEEFVHETLKSNGGDTGAIQHSPGVDHSTNKLGEPSGSSVEGRGGGDTENAFAMYFSSVGVYLDKALNEPGWATSDRGRKALDTLYDATQDLLHIASDVIADTEEVVREKMEEIEDNRHSESTPMEEATEKRQKITTRWADDIVRLFDQVGDYIDAVQQDRTTMRLVHALETLQNDFGDLLSVGREKLDKAAGELRSWTQKRGSSLGRLRLYTQWAAWALPQLLHLLPLEAIPVPRAEFKTGKVEGAFDALWVRGAALRNEPTGGRYGSVSGPQGTAPGASWQGEAAARGSGMQTYDEGGIGGKLIPDQILVRQWTEIRATLAEGRGAGAIGAGDARLRLGLMDGMKRRITPGIESVSRLRIKMNGIKACIRGMGYYFR